MAAGAQRREDADDWVYVTTDLTGAWLYAYDSGGDGAPVVYSVLPLSNVQRDPEHSPNMPALAATSTSRPNEDTTAGVGRSHECEPP